MAQRQARPAPTSSGRLSGLTQGQEGNAVLGAASHRLHELPLVQWGRAAAAALGVAGGRRAGLLLPRRGRGPHRRIHGGQALLPVGIWRCGGLGISYWSG